VIIGVKQNIKRNVTKNLMKLLFFLSM